MKQARVVTTLAVTFALVGLLALPAAASKPDRAVFGEGVATVDGVHAHVEVLVLVEHGRDAEAAVRAALKEQGAQPVSADYVHNGLVWNPPAVTQYYNPASEKVATVGALQNAHGTWNGAPGSGFRYSYGGTTSRCPSLVRECPGPQVRDSFQDVGWQRLGGTTLAVTWYTTSGTPDADVAVNTRFSWSLGCTNVSGRYDLQTVILHEDGHALGLGHSSTQAAVMYATYQGARCALHQDDINGIAALY